MRRRHTDELREMVGEWLRREDARGRIKLLSESLQVSPKTLNNWKRRRPRRGGRPKYTATQRKAALVAVARELRRQGYPGEKAVEKALPHVPLRLIREYVSKLKAKRRGRQARLRLKSRVSVVVKATNVIVCQDGAHLGRERRNAIETQLAKDRASQKLIVASVGPQTAEHVVSTWLALKAERGLPLVISTDNGAAYRAESAERYLRRECVVHLKSLPRTPEHNSPVERSVREVKEASAMGKMASVSAAEAKRRLHLTATRLNANRYRNLSMQTANDLDQNLPSAYNLVNREKFYAECMAAMCTARNAAVGWRAKRMAERNAVYEVLSKNGLVEITRGGDTA